jgi:3-hydroxyacyl-[acyl-carrier-protein] dehydratase
MLSPEDLPHRYPFLFIDRIERIVPGKEGIFAVNRSTDNFFSANRVPPSFSQSLLLEMMAEAAGLILISRQPPEEAFKGREGFLLKMDRVLFFQLPREGDRMLIAIEKTHSLGKLHRFFGEVRVGDTLLVRGELTLWQDE